MSEGTIAADALRLFIERIERLEEEKKGMVDDIKDVYSEAKATGYVVKTMRQVIRLRKLEKHVRQEQEALLETYKAALGMDGRTPDLFAGHDGRVEAAMVSLDADENALTLETADGVVIFENKAAKAKRAAAKQVAH